MDYPINESAPGWPAAAVRLEGCFYSWTVDRLQDHQWQQRDQGALCSWVSISIGFNLPLYSFPSHSCREVASFPSCTLTDT